MATESNRSGRKRRRTQPWHRRHLRTVVILGFIVALITVWFVWRLDKRSAWNDARQKAIELGVASTMEAFEARFGPFETYQNDEASLSLDSPYQAALEAYILPSLEAMGELPAFSARHPSTELMAVPYPPQLLASMTDYTLSNREARAALHVALQSGEVPGLASKQREIFVELLATDLCVRAQAGDVQEAFTTVKDGLILLRDGDRNTGPDSTAIAHFSLADRFSVALASALRRVTFSDENLRSIQAHLVAGDIDAKRKEQDLAWQSYWLLAYGQGGHFDMPMQLSEIFLGANDLNQAYYLNQWNARRALVGRPLAEQKAIVAGYPPELVEGRSPYWAPILDYQVVHLALDVLRYYQAQGTLPESLDALVPAYRDAVPTDFWADAPMRYVPDDTGFVVFSVGRDSVDEGGNPEGDISYRITLPNSPELASPR